MGDEDSDSADEGLADDDSEVDDVLRAIAHAPRPPLSPQLRGAADPLAVTFGMTSDGAKAPRQGDVVDGRYRIDGVLGTGGMGIVFAATHSSTGRSVALKWLQLSASYRTEGEREAAFQRFVREAQAAGRIRHPNVVDVYDAGTDPSTPFLVMERLEGETLRARIERGPIGWEEALGLLIPAMNGVAEAHLRGVVHRDLKPDNVFLARDGAGAVCPKVLDFGISRLNAVDKSDASASLTRTGTVIGTPAYMPLEQLRAESRVDARTDVYALGVVLYEMLTQKRPFNARNAADYAALMASERPVPLSRHRSDLRGPREAAVMRALARAPEDRYESVDAFVRALDGAGRARLVNRSLWLSAAAAVLGLLTLLWWLREADVAPASQPLASEVTQGPADTTPPAPALPPPPAAPTPVTAPAPPGESAPATADAVSGPARPDVSRARPPARRSEATTVTVKHSAPDVSTPVRTPMALSAEDFTGDGSLPPHPSSRAAAAKPSLELGRDQF